MKRFAPPCGILITLLLAVSCLISIPMAAQTILIDSTFTSNGEIFPFNPNDTIYGLSISGSVNLNSDTSLVRVILTDEAGHEWMVYEAYPLILPGKQCVLDGAADETMYLQVNNPSSLKVQVIQGTLRMDSLKVHLEFSNNLESSQALFKAELESRKVDSIQAYILETRLLWSAGQTGISRLSYSEKVKQFGDKYLLFGLDYYKGGIFDPLPFISNPIDNSDLVSDFDWRKKHNAHLVSSPYWDQDPDVHNTSCDGIYNLYEHGNGWMTSVKDQTPDCDTNCPNCCYIYGPVAVMEALVNLYYNYHYDLDLSEQFGLNCDGLDEGCNGGLEWKIYKLGRDEGIMDEGSLPWQYGEDECDSNAPFFRKFQSSNYYGISNEDPDPEELKLQLLSSGPLSIGLKLSSTSSLRHILAIVGYGVLKLGDTIHNNLGEPIVVQENNAGNLYWICKNSWGVNTGDTGYFYFIHKSNCQYYYPMKEYYHIDMSQSNPVSVTCINPLGNYVSHCNDTDDDGYYNWGLGPKPEGLCESTCGDLPEDCNDDDKRIGPCDGNFFEMPIAPEIEVYMYKTLPALEMKIENQSINSFSDYIQNGIIYMKIVNPGSAKLHLELSDGEGPVTILQGDDKYEVFLQPDLDVCISDESHFEIHFDGGSRDIGAFKLNVASMDEDALSDFEFGLIEEIDCEFDGVPSIIGQYVPWYGYDLIRKDIYIESGGTLEIFGVIAMNEQSDIFVEPGGKLILNGGKITGTCNKLWNGIDLWGNPLESQIESNQGYARIINGGCVENAKKGIETAYFDGYAYHHSGGIVYCDSAFFKDNQIGIKFHPYHYGPPGGVEAPNFSRIKNTEFEITDNFYTLDYIPGISPLHQVYIHEIWGLNILGSDFINNADKSHSERGNGIFSMNGGYFVARRCTDLIPQELCSNYEICTFQNLDHGINALSDGIEWIIDIDSASFAGNYGGIFMSGINDPIITRCSFDCKDESNRFNSLDAIYGIYLEYCTRYQIEEDTFFSSYGYSGQEAVGLHIVNSGPFQNEIYNNPFNNFHTGISAVGENRLIDTGVGLCIKCNRFTSCANDIYVTYEEDENGNPIITDNTGIALWQGVEGEGNDLAAGNTFSDNAEYNYINSERCRHIDYFYHWINNTGEKIYPEPILGVIERKRDEDAVYSKTESCPSHLVGGIVPSQEKIHLSSETLLISIYQDSIASVIDGGNTEGLNYEVLSSIPDEALEIRQDLLDESPFLSDTVMISAIGKEDVLPGAMIRDILVENPQAPKSSRVIAALNNRQDTIPGYMMDEIMEGLGEYGEKELLEQELGHHTSKRDNAWKNLNLYFKNDTANFGSSIDSLIVLYQNENRPGIKYELAFLYCCLDDSLNLFNTLDNIPITFELSFQDSVIHIQYLELFEILWDSRADSTGLDSLQIQSLLDLCSSYHSLPGLYAFNVLVNEGYLFYNEPVYISNPFKTVKIPSVKYTGYKEEDRLYLFPNPAGNYFIVQYNLTGLFHPCILAISDMTGKEISLIHLKDKQNQIIIPTKKYNSGTYVVRLMNGNAAVESKKISIIR